MLELSPSRRGVSARTRLRVVSWSGPIIGGIVLAVVAATATGASAAPTTPPSVASGTLAALNGSSIEVQNPTSGQVTVSWTPSTIFSQVQTVASSTLAVGDCVSATGAAPKTKSKTAAFTATTVSISHPGTNGNCSAVGGFGAAAGGFGGGGGFAGRGFGGRGGGSGTGSFKPPSGTFPGGGGARRAAGAFGGVAFGKVTSVSGSVITVVGERFAPTTTTKGTKSSTKTSKKTPPKPVKTTSKVTFTSSTAFTQTVTASSSALAVGQCVTALGPAGDTGAITASTINVRPAPSSGCVSFSGAAGFGRFGRGAGAGGTSA